MGALHLAVAAGLAAGLHAVAGATSLPAPELLPVAETEDGFVFLLRKDSLREHPLGHAAVITARGAAPRRLRRQDPGSPEFVGIDSHWVVDCAHGTFAIVRDRFYDASHRPVAEFIGSPGDQEQPVRGSVSDQVLRGICRHVDESSRR